MPQIISFHCISRHFALGSKTTSASSQGIVPVGRFRSGQSSERLNRGLPLQNDLVDQMIHHEQYKVLWNQYQLPNSDVKNGKVNTVFGFSSTISKFIMSPPWTLTDHSNIDVKNVVNYSHLNLIHFNNKAIYEMEIDSQLVIQCVLHDYVLVFKYPSDHTLHDSAWRSQNSMEGLANTSLPRRHSYGFDTRKGARDKALWTSAREATPKPFMKSIRELLSRPRSQNSRHVLGVRDMCARVGREGWGIFCPCI